MGGVRPQSDKNNFFFEAFPYLEGTGTINPLPHSSNIEKPKLLGLIYSAW